MSLLTFLSSLRAWAESAFDRAIAADRRDRSDEPARGDFISTLMIGHGARGGEAERQSRRGAPRG